MIIRFLVIMTMIGEVSLSQPQRYYDSSLRYYYLKDYTCPFTTSTCYLGTSRPVGSKKLCGSFNFTDEYGVERQVTADDGGMWCFEGIYDYSSRQLAYIVNNYVLRTDRDRCALIKYYGNISVLNTVNYRDEGVREIRKRWRVSLASITGACDYTKRLLYNDTLGDLPIYQNEPLFPSFVQCIPIVLEGRFTIECQNCSNYSNISYELMLINQCNETVYFEESSTTELVCSPWNEYPCANLNRGQPELTYRLVVTVVARNPGSPGQEAKSSTSLNLQSVLKLPDTDPAVQCEFNTSQSFDQGSMNNNKNSIHTRFRIDCTDLHKKYHVYNESNLNFNEYSDKLQKKMTVTTEMQSIMLLEYIEPVSPDFALPPGGSTISLVVSNCGNVIYKEDFFESNLPSGAADDETFYQDIATSLNSSMCNYIRRLLFNDSFGYIPSYPYEPLQPSFGQCIPMVLEGHFEVKCPGCLNYDNITYEMMILNDCNETIYFEEMATTALFCKSSSCENLHRGQPWFQYYLVVTVVARNIAEPNQTVKSSIKTTIQLTKLPDTEYNCRFNYAEDRVYLVTSSLDTRFAFNCTYLHKKYKLYDDTTPNFYESNPNKFSKKITLTTKKRSLVIQEFTEPISLGIAIPVGNTSVSIVVTNCDNLIYEYNFTLLEMPSGAPNLESYYKGLDQRLGSCSYVKKLLTRTVGEFESYPNEPLQPSFGPCIPMVLEGQFDVQCPNCVNYDNVTYEMMIKNDCNETIYYEESPTTRLVCASVDGFDCGNLNGEQPVYEIDLIVTVVARKDDAPDQTVKSSTRMIFQLFKLPDTDPAIKCQLDTTQKFVEVSGTNSTSALRTWYRIDCTLLHQKYQLYNESIPDFYVNHTHKFHKKVKLTFEERSLTILEYVEPVSKDFVLPPGNSTISIVVTNCDNVIYQDIFSVVDLPAMSPNEKDFNQGVNNVLDEGGLSGNLMVSVLIKKHPEMFLSDTELVLEDVLSILLKLDVDTYEQIDTKISMLGSIGEQMKNRSTEEVNVSLQLYNRTLDDLLNLDENVTSQNKGNLTGFVFQDIEFIINSMAEEQGQFRDMTQDTLLLLFDVLDKTSDVAVQNYIEMAEPVTLSASNTLQIVAQKVTKGTPRAIKLPIKPELVQDGGETFFEISEIPQMASRNITIKMIYLTFNPFAMFETSVNVTAPVFTVSVTDEKGDTYDGKNFKTPNNFVTPKPNIEKFIKAEMSIAYKEMNGSLTLTGGNLTLMIKFTMVAKETKILDIKLPKNISKVMIYGKALSPMNHAEIIQHGFEFPTSLWQTQKFYYNDLDISRENITNYRIHIPSDEANLRYGVSHYDMYFGITHDVKDSAVIQDLTDIVQNCKENNSGVCILPFDIEVGSLFCVFWDEDTSDWSMEGCQAYPAINREQIKCQCDHLSSFSSKYSIDDFLVEPVMITFGEDILLFATFFENPVVVTVVIVFWVVYFFLVYMARKLDRKDVEQIGVVECTDNSVTETYVYVICVMTGWWAQAGTTANVYINIKGRDGTSSTKRLSTTSRPCFRSGGEDWFVFTTEQSLGPLETVTVWHDNAGSSPHWYLNQVYVRDNRTETAWTFIYNDWLAVDRGTLKQAVASIPVVSEDDMKLKKSYHLFVISTHTLRDGHQWLSIVTKPAQSSFTRVQRLTCGLSLLLTLMLTNIMFYGLPTDNPEDQLDAGVFSFSLRQFIIGIESSLIMFPVNLLVLQLFIRVKQKPSKQKGMKVNKGGHAKRESGSIDPLSNLYLNLYKSDRFAKSQLFRNVCTLYQKEKKEVRGDEVVSKYLKICRQNMMWKVLKNCSGAGMDHDVTKHFTKRRLFSRSYKEEEDAEKVSSTILIDICKFDDTRPSEEVEPDTEEEIEHHSASGSIDGERELKPERNDTTKILPWWFIYLSWLVVMVICLTSSFFVMLYGLKYGYTRSIEWIVSFLTGFLQGALVEEPLKVIGISAFLAFVLNKQAKVKDCGQDIELADDEEYLVEVKEQKYNHQPLTEPISGALLKNIREKLRLEWLMTRSLWDIILYIFYLVVVLLMVYGHNNNYVSYQNSQTLRDLLVVPSNTPSLEQVRKPSDFYNYMKETYIPVAKSLLQTDKTNSSTDNHYMLGPYRIRQVRVKPGECHPSLPYQVGNRCVNSYWYTREDTNNYLNTWTNSSNTKERGPWTYQGSSDLRTLSYAGRHAIYPGGGYVKIFSENALDELKDLQEQGWIDGRTRAIFVECTVYNPNINIFSLVILLFELTPVGIIYTKDDILSTNLHHHSTELQWLITTCESLFLCLTLLYIYVAFKSYRKLGKTEYFGNSWNYVELLQITFSIVIIAIFIQRIITVDDTLTDFSQNGNTHFTSFHRAFHWDSILKYVLAFFVALVAGKAIRVFNISIRTKLMIATLTKARPDLFGFLLAFTIALIAYSHLGYLLFGRGLFSYRSIHNSLYSNTLIVFGSDIGLVLKDYSSSFGAVYLVSFVCFINYILVQFCLTILNISRIIAKFEIAGNNKLDFVDYLMTKIRLFFGKK